MAKGKNPIKSLIRDKKLETHFTPGAVQEMNQDEITSVLEEVQEGQNLKVAYKLPGVEVLGSIELKVVRKERSRPANYLKRVLFKGEVDLSRNRCSSTDFLDWEFSIRGVGEGKVFNVKIV